MAAANKICDNIKDNREYEYGVTIFKAKDAEKYYLTGVRRGTRWDIQNDGNAYLDYEMDRLLKSIDGDDDGNSIEMDEHYVAHVHSHPDDAHQVFSMGDYCLAYECYHAMEYKCSVCDYREKCDYAERRDSTKCKECVKFLEYNCRYITHRHECVKCNKEGNCGKPTIVTYLVADLTKVKDCLEPDKAILMKFDQPPRNEIFELLHDWTRMDDVPRELEDIFKKYVEVAPINKDVNSVIAWKKIDYPYRRESIR